MADAPDEGSMSPPSSEPPCGVRRALHLLLQLAGGGRLDGWAAPVRAAVQADDPARVDGAFARQGADLSAQLPRLPSEARRRWLPVQDRGVPPHPGAGPAAIAARGDPAADGRARAGNDALDRAELQRAARVQLRAPAQRAAAAAVARGAARPAVPLRGPPVLCAHAARLREHPFRPGRRLQPRKRGGHPGGGRGDRGAGGARRLGAPREGLVPMPLAGRIVALAAAVGAADGAAIGAARRAAHRSLGQLRRRRQARCPASRQLSRGGGQGQGRDRRAAAAAAGLRGARDRGARRGAGAAHLREPCAGASGSGLLPRLCARAGGAGRRAERAVRERAQGRAAGAVDRHAGLPGEERVLRGAAAGAEGGCAERSGAGGLSVASGRLRRGGGCAATGAASAEHPGRPVRAAGRQVLLRARKGIMGSELPNDGQELAPYREGYCWGQGSTISTTPDYNLQRLDQYAGAQYGWELEELDANLPEEVPFERPPLVAHAAELHLGHADDPSCALMVPAVYAYVFCSDAERLVAVLLHKLNWSRLRLMFLGFRQEGCALAMLDTELLRSVGQILLSEE